MTSIARDSARSSSARVWLNMNGSGTVAISDSFNVTSITDETTGHFDCNINSAMSNINYATAASNIGDTVGLYACAIESSGTANTVSKYEFTCRNTVTDAMIDCTVINTVVHGDLA